MHYYCTKGGVCMDKLEVFAPDFEFEDEMNACACLCGATSGSGSGGGFTPGD